MGITTYAMENTVAKTNVNLQFDKAARIPNIIEVYVIDDGKDYVKVGVQNYGIDTFDKVSFNIEIWDIWGRAVVRTSVTETDILPVLVPRTTRYYVKDWYNIKITNIQCWDGTDYGTMMDIDYVKN